MICSCVTEVGSNTCISLQRAYVRESCSFFDVLSTLYLRSVLCFVFCWKTTFIHSFIHSVVHSFQIMRICISHGSVATHARTHAQTLSLRATSCCWSLPWLPASSLLCCSSEQSLLIMSSTGRKQCWAASEIHTYMYRWYEKSILYPDIFWERYLVHQYLAHNKPVSVSFLRRYSRGSLYYDFLTDSQLLFMVKWWKHDL